jgi:hypothetical protein
MKAKARPFGVVGPRQIEDEGSRAPFRLTATGATVVGPAHGEHYEAVSRGNVFYAATASGGVAPGTSLSTTAAFWLHNPIGSDVFLVLIAASVGYVSGTIGAGTTFLTTHAGKQVANPTGTAITPRPTRVSHQYQGRALAFTTATVTTQVALRPAWSLGSLTAAAVFQPFAAKEQINGEIVVAPGYGVGLHSVAAAGTTPLVRYGLTWEEVPIAGDESRVVTL